MEFLQGFWAHELRSVSELELDRILSYVDNDQNGFITFGEFIVASVKSSDLTTRERI
jgi:hypothetical protein